MSLFLLATRTKDVVVVAESVSPIVYTSPAQAFCFFGGLIYYANINTDRNRNNKGT